MPGVSFLRSKAEQLADHLRGCLQRGELAEPLPGLRTWSKRLGVSRTTLDQAVRQLQHEGRLAVLPSRGVQLTPAATAGASAKPARSAQREPHRVLRVLQSMRDYPQDTWDWVPPFLERLQAHGIELRIERCTDARLRAYARQPAHAGELFCLASLPARYQRMFAKTGVPAVLLGGPAAGVRLPFVSADQDGIVCHATRWLLRRDFSRVALVVARGRSAGIQDMIRVFAGACADWPRQPVRWEVVRIPLHVRDMVAAANRFAQTVKDRRGIIVWPPLSVGLIMTALLQRGVAVGKQVELVAPMASPQSLQVCPVPVSYPEPLDGMARAVVKMAVHYFEHGTVPLVRRLVGTELVPGVPTA